MKNIEIKLTTGETIDTGFTQEQYDRDCIENEKLVIGSLRRFMREMEGEEIRVHAVNKRTIGGTEPANLCQQEDEDTNTFVRELVDCPECLKIIDQATWLK